MDFIVNATSIETLLWHIQRELMDELEAEAEREEGGYNHDPA